MSFYDLHRAINKQIKYWKKTYFMTFYEKFVIKTNQLTGHTKQDGE